ncbi:MAG: hypothetical protein LBT99_00965 [Bifidobacteriaceae bacterium]|jgi:hypothetical protein|nr:hypothetical protein [Bifidobacteriaceae bacterium]
MEIRKTNIENRKNNIEIRKTCNKFGFKRLGAFLCLFLFGIVTFVSGNLSQVNAASSSTVLPVAKGGTGSNSTSGARTNLNAQETLVSGTNIKRVFGQSLLGSGNVTGYISSDWLEPYQKTKLEFAGSDDHTVMNVVFNYSKRQIKFTSREWSCSYVTLFYTNYNGRSCSDTTKTNVLFTIPQANMDSSGYSSITTSQDITLFIWIDLNGYSGWSMIIERIR